MLEEYLFDDMELRSSDSGKSVALTIGEYVESLLIKEKYFGTPLPRIPVKVRQNLEEKLAPLPQYRKRMQANRSIFRPDNVAGTAVEVCVESGRWLSGVAQDLMGRSSTFMRIRVKLEDGHEMTTHLGKVVLRDRSSSSSNSDGSDSEGRKRKKRRSRSRSRRRRSSPNWSRWKGKSHSEMIEEFRERAKEDAVMGHGKVYPKRPLTFEGFATKYNTEEYRNVDRDAPSHSKRSQRYDDTEEQEITRAIKARQEDERQRNLASIFLKYGASKPSESSSSARLNEIDRPDVLRLG